MQVLSFDWTNPALNNIGFHPEAEDASFEFRVIVSHILDSFFSFSNSNYFFLDSFLDSFFQFEIKFENKLGELPPPQAHRTHLTISLISIPSHFLPPSRCDDDNNLVVIDNDIDTIGIAKSSERGQAVEPFSRVNSSQCDHKCRFPLYWVDFTAHRLTWRQQLCRFQIGALSTSPTPRHQCERILLPLLFFQKRMKVPLFVHDLTRE
jgi:hypothetical protein